MQTGLRILAGVYRLVLGLYLIVVFSFFLSVADIGFAEYLPMPPTTAAILTLLPLVLLAIVQGLTRKPELGALLSACRLQRVPLAAFLLLASTSLWCAALPDAYWQEQMKWIFLISYGMLIFLSTFVTGLVAEARIPFRIAVFLSVLLLLSSMMWDVYNPGSFSSEAYRAAGFPRNPNFAALVANMLCAAALSYDARRHWVYDVLVLSLTLLAAFSTQSRSGFLGYAALLLFYFTYNIATGGLQLRTVLYMISGAAGAGVLLAIVIPYLMDNTVMFTTYHSRFASFESDGSMDSGSAESRYQAALDSIRLINEAPLLGHGTAYSRRMKELPHNLYLMQWVNNGVPGLLCYIGLLAGGLYCFRRRRCPAGQGLMIVTIVGSCFSHNVLDQRTFLMLYGFLLGSSAIGTSAGQTSRGRAEFSCPGSC